MADRKSLTTGRRRQRREGAWPKGMYAYQNGDGFFFERRSRKVRGGRVWEPLGEDRNRAIARSTELNDAINRGDYEKSSSSGRRLTVSEFFEVALATREGHAPKTYAGYRSRVAHFLTYLNSEHPRLFRLSDVSSDVARGYLDWRRDMEVTRCGWKRSTTPTNRPAEFTLETDANRLRTLFQVGVERGFIGTNPFTRITPPKSKGKAKPDRTTARSLTETQARSLLKAARDYDQSPRGEGGQSTFKGQMYDMTRLYLLTGLRNRELIYLPWVHVDLDWEETGLIQIKPFDIRVTLHIHPSPLQAKRIDALAESRHPEQPLFESRTILDTCLPSHYLKIGRTFTKGDKQEHDDRIAALLACRSHDWDADRRCLNAPTRIRWRQKSTAGSVPLLPDARAILQRRKESQSGSPFVFSHPDNGPLKSDYWAQFKSLLKRAKLPMHFRVHDLRHTFGFTLRERGVPIETIMGLMRHANIEETMIYAKYSDKQGAKEIMRLADFAT